MVQRAPGEPRTPAEPDKSCFFSLATSLAPSTEATRSLHIALVGPDTQIIFEGFRHHPATHLLLIHTRPDEACARKVRAAFEQAGIPAELYLAGDEPYLGVLRAINHAAAESRLAYHDVIVNTSSGTPAAGCAAVTSAYLHGLTAFHIEGDGARILPLLRVPPRALLSETDVGILVALRDLARSEPAVARATRLERKRLRAHVDGEAGHKGLVALGLVERSRGFFRAKLALTGAGRTLLASGALTSGSPSV